MQPAIYFSPYKCTFLKRSKIILLRKPKLRLNLTISNYWRIYYLLLLIYLPIKFLFLLVAKTIICGPRPSFYKKIHLFLKFNQQKPDLKKFSAFSSEMEPLLRAWFAADRSAFSRTAVISFHFSLYILANCSDGLTVAGSCY